MLESGGGGGESLGEVWEGSGRGGLGEEVGRGLGEEVWERRSGGRSGRGGLGEEVWERLGRTGWDFKFFDETN
ncbi:hypothetical protein CgunFtcFv8_014153 [Champsocephalus gunnari]|uniref:Uncharacterized protein n=1 Tax=Champsocephalus gunnari TaxID=52237 RepID=A0AAN8E5X9_CHAGU|nr:hypothetical protein CgunFtcFv8_014153 [Champsocephalus gunnari]